MHASLNSQRLRDLPDLKRELLFGLALLAAAALTLAVVATLLAQLLRPRFAVAALILLIAADVAVLFAFGRHLIERLVLGPLDTLSEAADEVAAGNLTHVAPAAETREFSHLASRFNHMTERLQDARRQVVRVEKLASIGRLAAGVAHEIGNPLAAIGTYLRVVEKRGADRDLIHSITRETARIDQIVRGLLEYAGRRDAQVGRVDVGVVARGVLDLLTQQGTLKGISVRVQIEPDELWVRGRAHALEQVIVNLLLNAADAAPGGTLSIGAARQAYQASMVAESRRGDVAPAPEARSSGRRPWRPELADGTPGITLWVADSGPGVPHDDRERIFDPFFTTKAPGRGTGLGLAIVIRTVDELGGVVWVDDAREGGAAFKVFLPADQSTSGLTAATVDRGICRVADVPAQSRVEVVAQ